MLGETLSRIPLVRSLVAPIRRARAKRRFSGDQYGAFYGVYSSFAEAIADAPATKPFGYDHPAQVTAYRALLDEQLARPLEPYEEPVIRILADHVRSNPTLRVVDLGGNLGTHYYAYRGRIDLANRTWTIVEVPGIVSAGRALALERNAASLRFAATLDEALPADVLLASGSLFYLEQPLEVFSRPDAPGAIILNRMPLGTASSFVTLQNGGPVFYAQWVLSRTELLSAAGSTGYALVEEWEDRVDKCDIPLHAELSVPVYSGLYFRRP